MSIQLLQPSRTPDREKVWPWIIGLVVVGLTTVLVIWYWGFHAPAEQARVKAEKSSEKSRLGGEIATLKRTVASLTRSNQELRQSLALRSQLVQESQKNNSPPVNGTLQVKILRVYQSSPTWAAIDFQIKNDSNQFLDYWEVGADIYDRGGHYLAHYAANGKNIRADQTATATLLYSDIQATQISSWKPQIERVIVGSPGGSTADMTASFRLAQVESSSARSVPKQSDSTLSAQTDGSANSSYAAPRPSDGPLQGGLSVAELAGMIAVNLPKGKSAAYYEREIRSGIESFNPNRQITEADKRVVGNMARQLSR